MVTDLVRDGAAGSDQHWTDTDLAGLMRAFGVHATVVRTDTGVMLEGVAASYYGKQMAQEIARKADLVVVANRIRVRPAGNPLPGDR